MTIVEYRKQYYAKNREYLLKMARDYRETNKDTERFKEARRKYQQKYSCKPEQVEKRRRRDQERQRRKLGFTLQLEAALDVSQGGGCAICRVAMTPGRARSATARVRDHDHKTGKPRGLLCATCNLSLGIYEKHQRDRGIVIEVYDRYLAAPPARGFDSRSYELDGGAKKG